MGTTNTCSACGQKIVGSKYTHGGKNYCCACYGALAEKLEKEAKDKQSLIDYIKDIFSLSELPTETLNLIDRELKSGRTVRGLRATLWYYYDILLTNPTNVLNLSFVFRDQYGAAKEYAEQIAKLKKINKKVDLTPKTRVVQVKKDTSGATAKIPYKIEDL